MSNIMSKGLILEIATGAEIAEAINEIIRTYGNFREFSKVSFDVNGVNVTMEKKESF